MKAGASSSSPSLVTTFGEVIPGKEHVSPKTVVRVMDEKSCLSSTPLWTMAVMLLGTNDENSASTQLSESTISAIDRMLNLPEACFPWKKPSRVLKPISWEGSVNQVKASVAQPSLGPIRWSTPRTSLNMKLSKS